MGQLGPTGIAERKNIVGAKGSGVNPASGLRVESCWRGQILAKAVIGFWTIIWQNLD